MSGTVSERGMIFSAPMVKALLDGRKTVTRRIVKPQPPEDVGEIAVGPYHPIIIDRNGEEQPGREIFGAYDYDGRWGARCPYPPGTLIYVRETWGWVTDTGGGLGWLANRPHIHGEDFPPTAASADALIYRADGEITWTDDDGFEIRGSLWKPSIFMPKWAARIWLRVTDVRCERVQEITEEDALREGTEPTFARLPTLSAMHHGHSGWMHSPDATRREGFRNLWDSINGPGAWDRNDYVWVYDFERGEAPR